MDVITLDARAGQASLEFAAVVVVVAVAMAALALVAGQGRLLPRDLPPVPLPAPRTWLGDAARDVRPIRDTVRHPLPGGVSPAALRRWYADAPTAHRFALLGAVVAAGAAHEVLDELALVADDPAGYARRRLERPDVTDPRALAGRVRDLPGYLAAIRRLGLRDGSQRLAHDLGHLAGRIVVERFLGPRSAVRGARGLRDLARRIPGLGRVWG
jgi:hypothetical protein